MVAVRECETASRGAEQGKVVNAGQNIQSWRLRDTPGERTFLKGRISYNHGAISTDCAVVHISPTGAQLDIESSFSLPDIFDIVVPRKNLTCRAKLVWRDKAGAGVEFLIDEAPAAGSTEDYLAKITTLETLNAKLKSQIAELTMQVRRLTEET